MTTVEYHIDVIEAAPDGKPDAESLAQHLRPLGNDGWELVSLELNADLERFGLSHLLVFKRIAAPMDRGSSEA
jgi:hypothetical protein